MESPMNSSPRFDFPASSTNRCHESGFSWWVILIGIVAIGWLIAWFWIPPLQPGGNTPATPSTTDTSQPAPTGAKSRVGSNPQQPSALDSLSPDLVDVRKQIDDYFQKTQWDSAMDNSTAHRVARARDELEAFLSTLGPEHVDLLIGLLEEEPDFVNRRFLLRALGNIGTEQALSGLLEHYWWCQQEQKESEVKHTIDAIGSADNDFSFDLLSAYALSDDTLIHRYRFVGALAASSRSADAVGIYSQLLTDESHFRVRQRAAYGLKISGGLSEAHSIEIALQNERNPYVRQSFLGAIGGIRDVRSIPQVNRILREDEILSTRLSAVRALLRIEGAAAIEALQAARDDSSQPERVRQEAQRALVKLGVSG